MSTITHSGNGRSPHHFVGLDIGGTKIEALLVDQDFNKIGLSRCATDTSSPQNLVTSATDAINALIAQAAVTPDQIGGIGIGIPGQVNPENGRVHLAANLNLTNFPLGPAITDAFHAPTYLENDVRLAAIGVHRWLQTKEPVNNMAYLSIGTGVSAGLIANGRLYRGSNGMAGEIGHITVESDGAQCNCGARGCLETIISGPAIVHQAQGVIQFDHPEFELHAGHVYQAAANGNTAAQTIVQRVSQYLSRAIQWLIMTYDVDKVVLGGGVTGAGAAFLTPILSALSQLRAQSSLFAMMLNENKIALLPAGYNAGTWGAVYLAKKGDHQQTWG